MMFDALYGVRNPYRVIPFENVEIRTGKKKASIFCGCRDDSLKVKWHIVLITWRPALSQAATTGRKKGNALE